MKGVRKKITCIKCDNDEVILYLDKIKKDLSLCICNKCGYCDNLSEFKDRKDDVNG